MPQNVTLVFERSAEFDESAFLAYMSKASQKKPTGEYEKGSWSINGLSVKQYERKVTVQGSLNDFTKKFLRGLSQVKGLTMDEKNARVFFQIFPTEHNAILCPECHRGVLCVNGEMEGTLDIVFRGECGHKHDTKPPVFTLTNRVLPDISMLTSRSLSRLIELGHFNGFEVVVPNFILSVVDKFKGSSRGPVSDELSSLRRLEQEGRIRIYNLSGVPVKIDSSNIQDEDGVILGLAQLTNSILITSDGNFKDRAVLQKRPTVYISPELFGKLKTIKEVRNP